MLHKHLNSSSNIICISIYNGNTFNTFITTTQFIGPIFKTINPLRSNKENKDEVYHRNMFFIN